MAYAGFTPSGNRRINTGRSVPGQPARPVRVGGIAPPPARPRPGIGARLVAAPARRPVLRPMPRGTDLQGITKVGGVLSAPVLRYAPNNDDIVNASVPFPYVPPTYGLGDNGEDDYGQFGGFSLKGIVKGIKKVASPVQKVAAAVGHTVGNVATSKIGQGILGTALAVTGVGVLPAAGIFAAVKGGGNLLKPGGNIKHAVTGAAQGAIEGVVAVGAGKAVRAIGSKILHKGAAAATGAVTSGAKVLEQQQTEQTEMPPPYIVTRTAPPVATGPTPDEVAAQAQMQAQLQEAQRQAEQARADAARQVAEAQAAADAARQAGMDAQAQQYQAQMAELAKQVDAATQAAQAAQAAAKTGQGSQDTSQLQALLDAARAAAQAAQTAANAPPTRAGTEAAQTAAQQASDAAGDAVAGAPQETAGIMGGISPVVILAAVAGAALLLSKKKRGGRH